MIVAGTPPRRICRLRFGRPVFGVEILAEGDAATPFDAVLAGIREFDNTDRRRVLIAFTSGWDARSTTSFSVLAETARRLGPSLVLMTSPVKYREDVNTRTESTGGAVLARSTVEISVHIFPSTLRLLAHRTGGLVVDLGKGEPAGVVKDLLQWLRTRYVVTYDRPAGKGWHAIKTTTPGRKTKVTARDGYSVD